MTRDYFNVGNIFTMSSYARNPYTSTAGVPLELPRYGATFGEAVTRYFTKYATFSGRASRSEYWWVAVLDTLVGIVAIALLVVGVVLGGAPESTELPVGAIPGVLLVTLYGLATLIPGLALTVRRFHDGNFSGWMCLLALVPFLGSIAVLFFVLMPPNPAGARFDKVTVSPVGQLVS